MEGEIDNKIVETNAQNAPVKDITWELNNIQTESVQIHDPGVGRERIVRSYFFKSTPVPKDMPRPSKQQIIGAYKRLIENMLWSDGLIPLSEAPVQLYTKKETKKFKHLQAKMIEENADFVIMLQCEARHGQSITDQTRIAT